MSAMIAEEELCCPSSIGQPVEYAGLVVPEITAEGTETL
jgi:hypothetical protein